MDNENTLSENALYALAASPDFANDHTLFAAHRSGLFRSEDGGQSWQAAYASLRLTIDLPTTCLAISPDFASDRTVFAAVEGNILRSLDAGETWEYAELAAPPPLVTALALSPVFATDGLLLAGTLDDGIIRTTNRGTTWQRWSFGLLDPHIYSLVFLPDGDILAGTESGIFRSANQGRSWQEVNFPMELAPVLSLGSCETLILAGTEEHGLYGSRDGGQNWERLAPEFISGAVLQVSTNQTEILAVIENGIFYSQNNGKSWESRSGIPEDTAISSITAPLGLDPAHPLWVGSVNGTIIQL